MKMLFVHRMQNTGDKLSLSVAKCSHLRNAVSLYKRNSTFRQTSANHPDESDLEASIELMNAISSNTAQESLFIRS